MQDLVSRRVFINPSFVDVNDIVADIVSLSRFLEKLMSKRDD